MFKFLAILYEILWTEVTVDSCRHDITAYEFGEHEKRRNGQREAATAANL